MYVCVYFIYIFFFFLFFTLFFLNQFFLFTIYCCCTQNSFVNVFQFVLDRLWVSIGEFIHDIQRKVPISVFDEVNTIESTG